MKFRFSQIARVLGHEAQSEGIVTGWGVDSRTVQPGDLFFALRGPNHDGNAYVEELLAKGAAGAVTDRPIDDARCLVVPDTQAALERVGAWAREEWGGDVVGVTGSAGKTSTKDVIAELLNAAQAKPPASPWAGKTTGNFNNHVGVPLSILRLPESAHVAVLEIGMNHAGEIRMLSAIARPRIGVVTNVGYAHIEAFDSIEGIALAKRELIESLPADGIAILNADDVRVREFGTVHPGPVMRFGFSEDADVRAVDTAFGAGGSSFRVCNTRFETSLQGRHAVLNILAGLAVAQVYGIGPDRLVDAVRALAPGKMRGERLRHNDIEVINDCYNSNPDAVYAMLGVLRDIPAKRHIAVLGEMLELGRWSETLHREIGRKVAEEGINVLVGIRGGARAMVDAAMGLGLAVDAAFFFDEPLEAGEKLREIARPGDAILFKGSRGTRVERALERFLE